MYMSVTFLLAALLANAEARQVVIQQLTTGQLETGKVVLRRVTTGQRRRTDQNLAVAEVFKRSKLDDICAEAECPPLEKEEVISSMGISLRRYKAAEWLAYGSKHWNFRSTGDTSYVDNFMVRAENVSPQFFSLARGAISARIGNSLTSHNTLAGDFRSL